LISTLLSLSAVSLDLSTIATALQQVKIYYTKFRSRLATKHLLHIKRLVEWLKALHEEMVKWKDERKIVKTISGGSNFEPNNRDVQTKLDSGTMEILDVQAFVSRLGRKVESINLIEVEEYLRTSKVRPGTLRTDHTEINSLRT
jgi:chromosome transmission fidelity protein 1